MEILKNNNNNNNSALLGTIIFLETQDDFPAFPFGEDM